MSNQFYFYSLNGPVFPFHHMYHCVHPNHRPLSSTPFSTCVLSGLMYEEEGALIELMMCAMRRAALAIPPVGRTQGRKVVTIRNTESSAAYLFYETAGLVGNEGTEFIHQTIFASSSKVQ